MTYWPLLPFWPFWGTALALSVIPVAHWLLLGRMFAVSGRFTALNDRLREQLRGEPEAPPDAPMSEEELIAAMREATAAAFGDGAMAASDAGSEATAEATSEPESEASKSIPLIQAAPPSLSMHVIFLVALVAGGALSAVLAGTFSIAGMSAMGETFARAFGNGPGGFVALALGGVLVGFGTRMSGGCTSGHGLCGVSRFQTGSLAATCAFFGTGIAVSLILDALIARAS